MAELTNAQLLEAMAYALGQNVDNVTTWISSGPASNRNVLLTADRVINKALNTLDQNSISTLSSVNGFSDRFNLVVGDNFTTDSETFQEIGSNLIVAVRDLKNRVENDPGYVPSPAEQAVLSSGLTKEILDQILADLPNIFSPTNEQLDAINSGATSDLLTSMRANITDLSNSKANITDLDPVKTDIIDLQASKVDKADMVPITDENVDTIFADVFTTQS